MSLPARIVADRLRSGQVTRWVVRGGSMWPSIPDGSEVEAEPCAPGALRVGELVAYGRRDEVIVHRLVARTEGALTLRGDSVFGVDPPVVPRDVLGRVRVVRRAPLRWSRPARAKLLGAARLALAWLRSVSHAYPP